MTIKLTWKLLAMVAFIVASAMAVTAQRSATQSPIPAQDTAALDKSIYPLAAPMAGPKFTIDVSGAPDVRPWAERAAKVGQDWWPMLAPLLATEHYKSPKRVTLVFKENIGPPAYAAGNEITIKAPWIRAHPDDIGIVIHEMTHIIQHYPDRGDKPGWLVEGIADYIRWWRYEPETRRIPIDPERATYHDSYRTTAWFLAWVTGKYDRGLVHRLDQSLRDGTYSDDLFKQSTGKSVEELWTEFVATMPKHG